MTEFSGKVVILKADSKVLEVKEMVVDSSYEMLSGAVGGYIEAMAISNENDRMVTVWLNEEGKLIDLPPNFAIVHDDRIVDIVMGDIIITATDEEGDSVGLTDEEIELIKNKFDFNTVIITGLGVIERAIRI